MKLVAQSEHSTLEVEILIEQLKQLFGQLLQVSFEEL
jgi:hypothetical protein